MPELPEVETVRRSLQPSVAGRRFTAQAVLSAHVWSGPPVVGRRVESLARKGKYLIFELDGERALVVHLRMTGRLLLGAEPDAHTHALLQFDDGTRLAFRDVRRFGRLISLARAELPALLPPGDDAFLEAPGACRLRTLLQARRGPVKSLLLRQDLLAGLGNIYADESLWRAGVHPLRPGGGLRPNELEGLARGIRTVLADALEHCGTTFLDFRDAAGQPGHFARFLAVYGREGEACRRCGGRIQRRRIGGRSAHFCAVCQI